MNASERVARSAACSLKKTTGLGNYLGEKAKEGATRVELVTSRSAVECSATELYPPTYYITMSNRKMLKL